MSSPSYSKRYKLKYSYDEPNAVLDHVPVVFTLNDQNNGFVLNHNTLNLSSLHPIREMNIRLVYSYKNGFVFNPNPELHQCPENIDVVFYLTAFVQLEQPFSPSSRYFSLMLKLKNITVHINGVKLDNYMLKEEIVKIVAAMNKKLSPQYRGLTSFNVDLFHDLKISIDMYIRHIYKVITQNTADATFSQSHNRISPLNVVIGIS